MFGLTNSCTKIKHNFFGPRSNLTRFCGAGYKKFRTLRALMNKKQDKVLTGNSNNNSLPARAAPAIAGKKKNNNFSQRRLLASAHLSKRKVHWRERILEKIASPEGITLIKPRGPFSVRKRKTFIHPDEDARFVLTDHNLGLRRLRPLNVWKAANFRQFRFLNSINFWNPISNGGRYVKFTPYMKIILYMRILIAADHVVGLAERRPYQDILHLSNKDIKSAYSSTKTFLMNKQILIDFHRALCHSDLLKKLRLWNVDHSVQTNACRILLIEWIRALKKHYTSPAVRSAIFKMMGYFINRDFVLKNKSEWALFWQRELPKKNVPRFANELPVDLKKLLKRLPKVKRRKLSHSVRQHILTSLSTRNERARPKRGRPFHPKRQPITDRVFYRKPKLALLKAIENQRKRNAARISAKTGKFLDDGSAASNRDIKLAPVTINFLKKALEGELTATRRAAVLQLPLVDEHGGLTSFERWYTETKKTFPPRSKITSWLQDAWARRRYFELNVAYAFRAFFGFNFKFFVRNKANTYNITRNTSFFGKPIWRPLLHMKDASGVKLRKWVRRNWGPCERRLTAKFALPLAPYSMLPRKPEHLASFRDDGYTKGLLDFTSFQMDLKKDIRGSKRYTTNYLVSRVNAAVNKALTPPKLKSINSSRLLKLKIRFLRRNNASAAQREELLRRWGVERYQLYKRAMRLRTDFKIAKRADIDSREKFKCAAAHWRRLGSRFPEKSLDADSAYLNEFVKQKKIINKAIIRDRRFSDHLYDRLPRKYFFFHHRSDPVYRSFIIDKLINAFTKHGDRKKKIRNIFYKLMSSGDDIVSVDAFCHVIESLKPKYLNVVARRGRDVYRAPILASNTKSVMKAIHFFKKAVMVRKQDLTLERKIAGEMYDYLSWEHFRNRYYEDYVNLSASSMHLKHFRSKNKY